MGWDGLGWVYHNSDLEFYLNDDFTYRWIWIWIWGMNIYEHDIGGLVTTGQHLMG